MSDIHDEVLRTEIDAVRAVSEHHSMGGTDDQEVTAFNYEPKLPSFSKGLSEVVRELTYAAERPHVAALFARAYARATEATFRDVAILLTTPEAKGREVEAIKLLAGCGDIAEAQALLRAQAPTSATTATAGNVVTVTFHR